MISLDSDIMPIPAPYHFEANELNVMGGKLVYSYCTSWRERTNCLHTAVSLKLLRHAVYVT